MPSEFNKRALIESGLQIPIEVVEHALGDWWHDSENLDTVPDKGNAYVSDTLALGIAVKIQKPSYAHTLKLSLKTTVKLTFFLKFPAQKG